MILHFGIAMFLGLVLLQDSPESVVRGTKEFSRGVVVSGLAGPWEQSGREGAAGRGESCDSRGAGPR